LSGCAMRASVAHAIARPPVTTTFRTRLPDAAATERAGRRSRAASQAAWS
jgi:hypothetical protein